MMKMIWAMLLLIERQVMGMEERGKVRSRVMERVKTGRKVHHQIRGVEVLKVEELLGGIARNQRMRMKSVRADFLSGQTGANNQRARLLPPRMPLE